MTVDIIADMVVLTTVVVGLVDVIPIKLDDIDMTLLVLSQITEGFRGDGLTDGVRGIATGERHLHHIDNGIVNLHG